MKNRRQSFSFKFPPQKKERSIVRNGGAFFVPKKEEMRLDMEITLARIIALLKIIHNENMTTYRMFLGKKADEIISEYEKQLDEVLKMDIDAE